MPHQCIRCGKEYADGSDALLSGCTCGARFFFFFRERLAEKVEAKKPISKEEFIPSNVQIPELTKEEREQVYDQIKEIVPVSDDKPVILDLESIKVLQPGKYEIDLVSLFKRKPVIYKHGDGKYVIDVESTFKILSGNKAKK